MTQYYTDFSENAIASGIPSGWTAQWGSDSGAGVVAGNPLAGSDRSFEWGTPATSFDRLAVSYDAAGTDTDTTVYARVAVEFSTVGLDTNIVGAVVSGAGSIATRSGYYLFIRGSGNLTLVRASGGTESTLDSVATPYTTIGPYDLHIEIARSGSTISAWIWEEGGSKPGTPTLTAVDGAPLAAGWAGINSLGANDEPRPLWRAVGIGTSGDSAPTEPLPTGPAITSVPNMTIGVQATITGSGFGT